MMPRDFEEEVCSRDGSLTNKKKTLRGAYKAALGVIYYNYDCLIVFCYVII